MVTGWIGAILVLGRKVGSVCVRDYTLRKFAAAGKGIRISSPFHVYGAEHIHLGDGVVLGRHTTLRALTGYPWTTPPQTFSPRIEIRDGAFVNAYTEISAAHRIVIGRQVMIAEGCFITDNAHRYDDVSRSIREQPVEVRGEVHIGDGSLIGCHTFIQGDVSVGRHCVVGANSVVTRSLPDFCVAAGAPARVIKRFDEDAGRWRETDPDGAFRAEPAS